MSINRVIAFNKVKFDTLNDLFKENSFNENEHINVFINVSSITEWLYNKHNRNEIIINENDIKYNIVYELLNIAMHYRLYFNHFYKLTTSFIFYYSDKSSMDNKFINNQYDMVYEKRREENNGSFLNVTKYLNKSLEIFGDVIKYVYDCFYINSNDYERSLIPLLTYLSNVNKKNEHNLIITKDIYEYQLVNFGNTTILTPNKEDSILVERYNLIDSLLSNTKHIPKYIINSNFMTLILSVIGVPSRNIKGISGIGIVTVLKKIEKYIDHNGVNKGVNIFNILTFIDEMFPDMTITNKSTIANNFAVIDLKLQIKRINREILISKLTRNMVNLRNDKSLFQLNNELFKSKVNLDVLYKGVR